VEGRKSRKRRPRHSRWEKKREEEEKIGEQREGSKYCSPKAMHTPIPSNPPPYPPTFPRPPLSLSLFCLLSHSSSSPSYSGSLASAPSSARLATRASPIEAALLLASRLRWSGPIWAVRRAVYACVERWGRGEGGVGGVRWMGG
jgi:hypothetical protein